MLSVVGLNVVMLSVMVPSKAVKYCLTHVTVASGFTEIFQCKYPLMGDVVSVLFMHFKFYFQVCNEGPILVS
jgi:hypothetical protein